MHLKRCLPVLSVLLAGTLWGIISFFIKALSASGLDAMQITFIRYAVAAPVMSAAVAVMDRGKLRIRLRDVWMFIGTGIVSIVLFNICYFYTMIHAGLQRQLSCSTLPPYSSCCCRRCCSAKESRRSSCLPLQ